MLTHPAVFALLLFLFSCLVIIGIGLIFHFLTPIDRIREQLAQGNLAVALALGGEILATALILHQAIIHNDTIWQILGWSALGFAMLLIAGYGFQVILPGLNVRAQIAHDNRAVGFIVMSLYLAFGWIIKACIF
ncbi:MAG: DUF350 domain-containing protein [Heliobacteriaceae bacterium]|nr:DUF350 domain-containing protein [Heliobacteriaceae bacterium]MDD4586965.1 DUF350 domain-containing protein [Heliobacteriaceae bacterium]